MSDSVRLMPSAETQYSGKVLFVGMMNRNGKNSPCGALAYLAPALNQSGHEVVLSNVLSFPDNSVGYARGEIRERLTELKRELYEERPDYVAFPVYDLNSVFVQQALGELSSLPASPTPILGGPFITINADDSRAIFGNSQNLIMVNGEAEYALPEALRAFEHSEKTLANGIYVRRGGVQLGGNFLERVALTQEEHEALVPDLRVFEGNDPKLGISLTTSRGCFEGCTICSASWVFRPRHVSWSNQKRTEMIAMVDNWLRAHGITGKTAFDFQDDNLLFGTEGREFFGYFAQNPLSDQMELYPQFSINGLFNPDGNLREELIASMVRPDGTNFVRRVDIGIDFWSPVERARNKGGQQGKLTNEQIRAAIKSIVEKKIGFHAYWIYGDEQTNLSSMVKGLIFLADLIIDFAPYIAVDPPGQLQLRTGTEIRRRILARKDLPKGYLNVSGTLEGGGRSIKFYEPIFPINPIFRFILEQIILIKAQNGVDTNIQPEELLGMLWGIEGKWENQIMNERGRAVLARALALFQQGQNYEVIKKAVPELSFLPTRFPFLGADVDLNIRDFIELAAAVRTIPSYLHGKRELYDAERRRRNPDYEIECGRLKEQGLV